MSADRRADAAPPASRPARRRSGASSREFLPSGSRCSGWWCSPSSWSVAIFAPLDRAAEPLRSRPARHHGRPAAAGFARRRDGYDLLARHRRPGPRHAVRHLVWAADLAGRRRRLGADRLRGRQRRSACSRPTAGGRIEALIMRLVDLQLSFPAILVALMILAVPRQGRRNVIARAGDRANGPTTPARCARSALVERRRGIHRGGASAWRCRAAHRVPPSAAELPAAADRRRHHAGGARHRAGGDAVASSASACRSPSLRSAC